jgi:hypothetical protein
VFLEVSEFYQLPHGAITPQYLTLYSHNMVLIRKFVGDQAEMKYSY